MGAGWQRFPCRENVFFYNKIRFIFRLSDKRLFAERGKTFFSLRFSTFLQLFLIDFSFKKKSRRNVCPSKKTLFQKTEKTTKKRQKNNKKTTKKQQKTKMKR